MPLWMTLLTLSEAFTLPIIGSLALAASKLTVGASAQAAQRWFLGVLLAVTLVTCRTVISCDACWLLHTATLAMMAVGSLLLPDRQTLEQRRLSHAPRLGL
jgi:hypothetical protein